MKIRLCLSLLLACAAFPAAAQKRPNAAEALIVPTDIPGPKPWLSLEALRAKYADRKGRIATIGGVEVYYKDEGKGPAILLIHGSASSLATYDGLADDLSKRYRVIRFDIPPQGLSGPVSSDAIARLVPTDIPEQLLGQLGVRKVTIVGVSSGGTMGVQLAAKRPDLVERLILSNAPADPVRTDHQVLTPELAAAITQMQALGYQSRSYWKAFLDYYAGVPARYDARYRERVYDMNRRTPSPMIVAFVAKVENHDAAVAAMAGVTAPVLLLWGMADPLLPPAAMEKLAGYLTHATVSKVLLPDVGHYPPNEIPHRYAKLVEAFIEAAVPDAAQTKR